MEKTIHNTAELIEKEMIPNLSFKHDLKITQATDLMDKLVEATKLGNIHHGKIAIIFQDDDGIKRVETTIWATGAKYICLKGGMWLPIHRIIDIKMV